MTRRFILRQEIDTISRRNVVATAVGSVVVLVAAVAVSGWLLGTSREGRDVGPRAPAVAPTTIGTVEQRLVLGPPRGIDARVGQRATLDRWGWVDRDAGVARIPVERAMDLVLMDGGEP